MHRCFICAQQFITIERMVIWRGLDGEARIFCIDCVHGRLTRGDGDGDE